MMEWIRCMLPMRIVLALLAAGMVMGMPVQAQVSDPAAYLARMDLDGDGRVSLEEYVAWMSYAFDAMDRDGDGVLSREELPGGRGKPVTRAEHRARIVERFHKQDVNGDGVLSEQELSAPPR